MHRPFGRALRAWALALVVTLAGGLVAPAAWAADETPPLSGVLNVNTATPAQLMVLPGIGEAKARAIVELREARGGFSSLDELVDVKGIGSSALARIRPYLTLEGASTLGRD